MTPATKAPRATTTAEREVHTAPVQDVPNEAHLPVPVTRPEPAAAVAPTPLVSFTAAQIEIIKHTYMPGATDDELTVFIAVCTSRQLNPFTRQIYAIKRMQKRDGKRVEVWTHQTSIDGFRLIAERTKKYRGQTVPLFCGADGVWTEAWLSSDWPAAAKVGVLREDFDQPIYAIALWREYVQAFDDGNPMAMWAKMPSVMLAKVAEALALRKAFPEELSGLYTDDEMAQAAHPDRAASRREGQTQAGDHAAGSGASAPARPADPYSGLDPDDGESFTLERCRALPLVGHAPKNGKPGAWGGHGQAPLGEVPLAMLQRAFTWFGEKLDEHRAAEDRGEQLAESKAILAPTQVHRFRVMRVAIPVVIADLERAQGQLPLAGDSAEAPRTAEKLESKPPVVDVPVEGLHAELKALMDHAAMPTASREYFQARLVAGMIATPLALKMHIAMAQLCVEIGERLHAADPRQVREYEGLLKQLATYKLDVLTKLRDNVTAAHAADPYSF